MGFVDLLVDTKRKQILCERNTPVDNLSVIPVILNGQQSVVCLQMASMYV